MSKRLKITLFVSIGIVTVIGLVLAGIFLLPNLFKKETVADQINKSTVGQNINNLTTVNGENASTVIIAPPTADWWWTLGVYSPNPTAYTLDFNKYSEGSKYIAYTVSPGANFEAYGYLGLPTTFIIYENDNAAKIQADKLTVDGISHQLVGNVIFFVPDGAFSDVNYALNQYNNATDGEDLELNGSALMYLEYKSLKTFMYQNMSNDMDKETFDTLAGLLGVTEDTYWSGTSKDGFTWEGQFSGFDTSSINSPEDIQSYLDSRFYFMDSEGNLRPGSEATENNQSGIAYPGQSRISGAGQLVFQSNDSTSVVLDENGEKVDIPVLPASEGVYRITVDDVNGLIGSLLGDEVTYGYTTFGSMSLTIKGDGSGVLVIVPDEKILSSGSDDSTSPEENSEDIPVEESTEEQPTEQ